MKLILLGLPGAGKGTIGKRLAARLSVPHISIGDRVRELVSADGPLGEKLRIAFSASGGWAPLADDLAVQIAEASLEGLSSWIVDGFPHNTLQAERAPWLKSVDAAILFTVSHLTARARVLGRHREGDSLEKFERRMAAERDRFPPLIRHLRDLLRLVEVDADQGEDEVFASVICGFAAEGKVL